MKSLYEPELFGLEAEILRSPRSTLIDKHFSIDKTPRKQKIVILISSQRSVTRKIGPERDFEISRRSKSGVRDAKKRTVINRAGLIRSKDDALRINQVLFIYIERCGETPSIKQ